MTNQNCGKCPADQYHVWPRNQSDSTIFWYASFCVCVLDKANMHLFHLVAGCLSGITEGSWLACCRVFLHLTGCCFERLQTSRIQPMTIVDRQQVKFIFKNHQLDISWFNLDQWSNIGILLRILTYLDPLRLAIHGGVLNTTKSLPPLLLPQGVQLLSTSRLRFSCGLTSLGSHPSRLSNQPFRVPILRNAVGGTS